MIKMSIINVDGVEVFQEVSSDTQKEAFINQGWKEVKEETKETKKAKAE